MTRKGKLVVVITVSAVALLCSCAGNIVARMAVQELQVNHYQESVWECTARCDPYEPVVSALMTAPGLRSCGCVVPPEVVHRSQSQAILDSITSEPEQGWTMGK